MRTITIAVAILSAALAVVSACADTDPPPVTETPDAADAPDTSSPIDARDAGQDAPWDASFDAASEPVVCAVTPCAVALAAGTRHACALIDDGTVRCWGSDLYGALGAGNLDGGPDPSPGPVKVASLSGATQISAAGVSTCARTGDGKILCWGTNGKGQLGLTTSPPTFDFDPHPAVSEAAVGGVATRVDVGHDTTCAHLASGELVCWGANDQNQLLRTTTDAWFGGPGPLGNAHARWSRTMFGTLTGYAITEDRGLVSWGVVSGRNTSLLFDPEPRALAGLTSVTDVAATQSELTLREPKLRACVIADGRVYCWGRTDEGVALALCNGVPNSQRVPVMSPVHGPAFPQQIALGSGTTCVRLTDGTVECCGENTRGELGRGTVTARPAALSFGRASVLSGYAVQVVTLSQTTCVLLRDGRVQCWGGNEVGELGQHTVDFDPHPAPLTVSF